MSITQEQLERLKDARKVAEAATANVKANKELWQIENRLWDDYRRALTQHDDALIAAAEEGLKSEENYRRWMEANASLANNNAQLETELTNRVSEAASLQARVRELEEALKPFASIRVNEQVEIVPNGYSSPLKWREEVLNARAVLSTSQPQEPRFTVEEIITDFQRTANAINREDAPNVKTACEFAIAYLRDLNPQPNPRS